MLALRAGTAAGVYVAMESAVEETRGRTDWVSLWQLIKAAYLN